MSLISHFKLNGDGRDEISGFHGDSSGCRWADGLFGQCLDMVSGTTSVRSIPRNPYTMPKSSFSISCYLNPSVTTGSPHYLFLSGRDMNNSGFGIHRGSTERHVWFIWMNGQRADLLFDVPINEWSLVTLVYDANQGMSVHVNGVLAASNTRTTEIVYPEMNGSSPSIGSHGGIYPYKGYIEDFKLYNHALSLKEIEELNKRLILKIGFQNGSLQDESGNHGSFVNSGMASVYNEELQSWTYRSADKQKMVISDITVPESCTIEFIGIRTASANVMPFSFETRPIHSGPDLYFISGRLAWNTGDSGDNSFKGKDGVNVTQPPLNVWHHYVVVNSKTKNKTILYVNGEWYGEATYKSTQQTNKPFQISGWEYSDLYSWIGQLTNLRLYGREFTDEEVESLYKTPMSLDHTGNLILKRLITGYANGSSPTKPTINLNYTALPGISEIGIYDKMFGYYPLEGNANDYGPFKRNGIVTGDTQLQKDGLFGKGSYLFNTNTDNISIPSFTVPSKTFSCMVWVKFNSNHPDVTPESNYYATALSGNFRLSVHLHTDVRIQLGDAVHWSGNATVSHGLGYMVKFNEWILIGMTYDGSKLKSYCNGFCLWEKNTVYEPLLTMNNVGLTFRGGISAVKLFDRILTEEEFKIEHALGSAPLLAKSDQWFVRNEIKEIK